MQPAENAAQAAIPGRLGNEGDTAGAVVSQTSAQEGQDSMPMRFLREPHGPIQVVRIGQGQSRVTIRRRPFTQRLRTGNAFEERIPAMYV
jgi:hypothetical protein